jgi:hypothetical protein
VQKAAASTGHQLTDQQAKGLLDSFTDQISLAITRDAEISLSTTLAAAFEANRPKKAA